MPAFLFLPDLVYFLWIPKTSSSFPLKENKPNLSIPSLPVLHLFSLWYYCDAFFGVFTTLLLECFSRHPSMLCIVYLYDPHASCTEPDNPFGPSEDYHI